VRIWNNKERPTFMKSQGSNRPRARIRLVVAIRLQSQYPPFRLHVSSNTPFIRKKVKNGTYLLISNEGNALSIF
jgi:hypothetical protein